MSKEQLAVDANPTMSRADHPMIPGATSMLGWGFNIFGAYSSKSTLRQLLDLTKGGSREETVNGVEYNVPNTVTAGASHKFTGSATFFSKKEEITNYFSVKAGISGGYAGFKGSLDVGYTKDELNTSEYNYAIFDGQKLAYPLSINNANQHQLADSVLTDPDYIAMMKAAKNGFDRAKPAAFYTFFLKYGTHFVNKVDMGGSLYYYAAINKSYSKSSKKVSVDASLEYNGLFDVKATADVDWNKVGEEWVNNRQMQLVVVGGDVNFPVTADASFGTNMNEQYNKWIDAVDRNPSPMGFRLLPIDALFSGKEAGAIQQALQYFIASQIYIELDQPSITMAINGFPINTNDYKPVTTNPGFPVASYTVPYMFSYVAMVVDRETGLVVDQASVLSETGYEYFYKNNSKQPPASTTVPASLLQYEGNQRYLLIFMWYGENNYYTSNANGNIIAPSGELRSFLVAAGAGSVLANWENVDGAEGLDYNVYILVGTFGLQGEGFETMATTSLNDRPASASMTLAFTPQEDGDGILFTPSMLN